MSSSLDLRRLRAIIVMMAIWGVAAAIVGGIIGGAIWFFAAAPQKNFLLWDSISLASVIFGFGGLIGGAGFALMLSRRGQDQQIHGKGKRNGLLWWMIIGAIAGMLGELFFLLASGQAGSLVHPYSWASTLITMLKIGGAFALVGGGVGTGILAIAKRGKALPSVGEPISITDGE